MTTNYDPNNSPESQQAIPQSGTYGFSPEIQLKIVAMLLLEQDLFIRNVEVVLPDYFENPILGDFVRIIFAFYQEYHRIPTPDEFIEEVDVFTASDRRLPREEYFRVLEEVFEAGDDGYFDYVKDKTTAFAKYHRMRIAISQSVDLLLKKQDYSGISSTIQDAVKVGEKSEHHPEDIIEFLGREKVRREIFVRNWAERNSLTILAGGPKTGKSVLVTNLMLKLALGKSFLDFEAEQPKKTLYIQQEIPEWALEERLIKMIPEEEERQLLKDKIILHSTTGTPFKISDPKDAAKISEQIDKHKPDLVIFDPLGTFHTKSENDAKEMSTVLEYFLKLIGQFNIGVIVVHHHGKPSDRPRSGGHMPRGSSVLGDRADIIINVRQPRHHDARFHSHYANYAELEFVLRSGVPIDNIVTERDPNTLWNQRSDDLGPMGRKGSAEMVRRILIDNEGEMLQKDMIEALQDRMSRPVAIRNIQEAEEKDYLEKIKIPEKGSPVLLKLK